MLIIDQITKKFGNKTVLKDIRAIVRPGDFIIMVGANGSGKSTLFNIISGALRPDQGNILVLSEHLPDQAIDITHTNEMFRTQWMGQLFQNPKSNTIEHMSVSENISLALMKGYTVGFAQGEKTASSDIIHYIKQEYDIDVTSLLNKKMSDLSGGQRQLIAFVMATINKPPLLLLDEPTAALDPQAATILLRSAYRFIKEHNMTAILVTHDPELALTLGNKLWLIKDNTLQEFDELEKGSLSTADLVGHIDYAAITG